MAHIKSNKPGVLLFLLLIIFPLRLSSQSVSSQGSATKLNGKTFVLSIFLTTPKNEWEYRTRYSLLQKQKKAQHWLQKQAGQYDINIDFESRDIGYETNIVMDSINRYISSNYTQWLDSVFAKTEFHSQDNFRKWVSENTKCQNCIFIIYANQRGRSYAITHGNRTQNILEGCIVYKEMKSGNETFSATIAHEILHLFGAWDLYDDYLKDNARQQLADMYFPRDIMLHEEYYVQDCKIDKLTAWRVGLTTEYHEWYMKFRP